MKNLIENKTFVYILALLAIVLLNSIPWAFVFFFGQGQEIIRGMTGPPSVYNEIKLLGFLPLSAVLLAITTLTITTTSSFLWSKFVSAMSEVSQENPVRFFSVPSLKARWLFVSYLFLFILITIKYPGNYYFAILTTTYIIIYSLTVCITAITNKILCEKIFTFFDENKTIVRFSAAIIFLIFACLAPYFFYYTLSNNIIPAAMLGPIIMIIAICNVLTTCAIFVFLVMPNYALVLTSICTCLTFWWALHANRSHGDVHLISLQPVPAASVRTQQDDFNNWLKHVQPGPDGKKLVIVALASGGGIRAASFASQLLGNLQDENPTLFFSHLYAVSGVSGGSIGVATVAGEMGDATINKNYTNNKFIDISQNISARDLLTPVLYHLLVTDALCQVFSATRFCRSDRSSALDDAIMNDWFTDVDQGPNQTNGSFTSKIFSSTLANYEILRENDLTQGKPIVRPVLLFSATDIQTAQTVLISSSADLTTTGESDGVRLLKIAGKTLKIGTSVSLSARFPIITAPGRIDIGPNSAIYLTDGGYSDNSGARAMLVLLRNLFDTMPGPDLDKVNLLVLKIDANPCHSQSVEASQKECDSYLKPAFKTYFMADAFTAFESVRERNTRNALADLKRYLCDHNVKTTFVTYHLSPKPYVVPLGWYISTESQENIKKSIRNYTSNENKQVQSILHNTAQDSNSSKCYWPE